MVTGNDVLEVCTAVPVEEKSSKSCVRVSSENS
jgi:hypothetical protein